MTVIELHREFSKRFPYVPPAKIPERICGQADYIAPEKAWELVVALLRSWKSQAIMLTYEKDNPSRFNREARFLLLPMWENECISVKEVFFSGKPIVFTDLTNGGSALFCLSEYEDENETFELLLYGDGSHHDLAEKARQLHGTIELFIPNMDITQYIDLESYSSSPGFLGYTDHGKYSETAIESVCDDFLKKMAAYINDVTVISSLFISSNKEEVSADYDISLEKIDKFLHALLKNGMVKTINLDTLPDPDSPLFDQEFRKLETAFSKLHSPDAQTLKDILQSFFHAVGLHGHIFLVFCAAKLIVYPHTDDLGFGFISMHKNKDRQQEQTEWLQKCFYNFKV